jgi:hypothetical protein
MRLFSRAAVLSFGFAVAIGAAAEAAALASDRDMALGCLSLRVAGLVQLRSDIGCAAIASGAVSVRSADRDSGYPIVGKSRFYDPIDHVKTMRQRPDLRLFVVSDRNDKIVSYRSQLARRRRPAPGLPK